MGVDVSTYRARIGCFSNRSKQRLHHLPPERLNFSCFGSLRFFKLFAVATVVLVLLSTSGDVESNPGLLTRAEKLDKLQHAIEALTTSSARYQQESSEKLDAINAGIGCSTIPPVAVPPSQMPRAISPECQNPRCQIPRLASPERQHPRIQFPHFVTFVCLSIQWQSVDGTTFHRHIVSSKVCYTDSSD